MVHSFNIRVRYAETDQMSYVYYGNYAQYFEVGRVEFLRSQNYSYKQLEEDGVMMPVVEMNIKYKRPAKYDDLLTIQSSISTFDHKRVVFKQVIINDNNKILTEGTVELAFIDSDTMRSIECPVKLKECLQLLLND